MADIVDRIVERFRDAAFGLADWSDALALIAGAAGGHVAQLAGASRRDATAVNFVSGVSADQVALYFRERGNDPAVNPRTRHILTAAAGHCVTDAEILAGEARRPPIYHRLFRRLDVPHAVQVRLDTAADLTFGLVLLRSAAAGAHDARETALLRLAAPGIAGAVQAAAALGVLQDRVVLDTAELLQRPAILLDRDRGIVSLSASAEAVLRAGRFLTTAANRLLATCPAGTRALDRAIGAAVAPLSHERRSSCVALTDVADTGRLLVDLAPLPTRLSGPISSARVLMTLRVPHHSDRDQQRSALMTAFALTPAEADIALSIFDGTSLTHIADQRGTSVGTVRTQLKAIFEKTRTRRQTELLLLMRQIGGV